MSYAEVDAQIVLDACLKYFKQRADRISKEKEALIQEEMKCGWFGRTKTREQAIASLESECWTGEWWAIDYTGIAPFERVEALFALANAKCVDKIMVSANDAKLLGL